MPPNRSQRVTAVPRIVFSVVVALVCTAAAMPAAAMPAATDTAPSPTPIPNPFDMPVGGEPLGEAGVVEPEGDLPPVPDVPATSFVVADLASREVLAAKNAHESLEPGSAITLLMGLTLLGRLDLNAVHEARRRDVAVDGNRVGLQVGTEYAIDQLFYGLFLRSGNDAAAALTHAAGGADHITGRMNERAARLGAFDTRAAEGTTLESTEHRSSAYDLALVAAAGLENEDFVRYTSTASYTLPGRAEESTTGPDVGTGSATEPPDDGFRIENDNTLLATYADATGVFADPPGGDDQKTIVGVAERDGQRILVAVMRADAPAGDSATALLDWGFEVAESVGEPIGELVTPADVADAAAGSTSPSAEPTTDDPEAGGTVPPPAESAPRQESPFPYRPLGLDPPQLMLLGLAALFVVLAGTRVRQVVRDRRRAGGSAH